MDASGQALGYSNEINNEDIIRNLPESVLGHILSCLPTKDAVRTSVLSTEWKDTWTAISNLEFSDELPSSHGSEAKKEMFINFIKRVLLRRGNSEIRKCAFDCFEKYDQSLVDYWISTAVGQKVQKLMLRFRCQCFELPSCLFNSASLQELRLLSSCIFRVPTNPGFSNLKIIYLEEVQLMNESHSHSSELLFTFPVLEHFTMLCCIWPNVAVIKIEAPHLSIFEMMWPSYKNAHQNVEGCMIKIFGASLTTFKYAGSFVENFILPSPSTISEAIVDFVPEVNHWSQTGPRAEMLLRHFSALNSLTLDIDIIEALHRTGATYYIPDFNSLIYLKLLACFSSSSGALISFISKAPNLRSIDMEVVSFSEYNNGDDAGINWVPPQCVTCSLEKVTFTYYGNSVSLHLMEYLLKNALVLQVVHIVDGLPENLKTQIRRHLLTFPMASSNAVIEFVNMADPKKKLFYQLIS